MSSIFTGLLFTMLFSIPAVAQDLPGTKTIIIKNVSVIDMKDGKIKYNQTVIISGNKIDDIKKSNKSIPSNAQVIDGSDKFLIPGLWDMHVHIFNNSANTGTDNHENYFPLFIANGVTGVRDMWTDPDDIQVANKWKEETAAGKLIAPRIAVGSSIVDGVPVFVKNSLGVSTEEEARQAVRTLKNAGAGFIKVYWNLTPALFYAIADESKKLGIDFAGHVPFSMSAAAASDAGQKSIEHMTGVTEACSSKEEELRKEKQTRSVAEELLRTYDESKCVALFKRFAKNKTWHTPTTVLHRVRVFWDQPEISKNQNLKYSNKTEVEGWLKTLANRRDQVSAETRRQRFKQMLEAIGKMHKAGVPLLAGSDLGNPFIVSGFSLHDELEFFVHAGLTPFESLKTATTNAANYLNLSDSLGVIEKGKLADLVLLDANPLENISNTKKIAGVVTNGRYLSREDLQKMLSGVEDRAKKN